MFFRILKFDSPLARERLVQPPIRDCILLLLLAFIGYKQASLGAKIYIIRRLDQRYRLTLPTASRLRPVGLRKSSIAILELANAMAHSGA